MAELFSNAIVAVDELYRIVRDEPSEAKYRQFAERLWTFFEPFADDDFTLAIAKDFHARFWEMYLAFGLDAQGHRLLPTRKAGPDLLVEGPERPVWIEAVAAQRGEGADQVPEMELGRLQYAPDERIVLRFRASIEEKFRKLVRYRQKGIVGESDPFIVALNGRAVPFAAFTETDEPRILRALFGIGQMTVTLNRETMEVIDTRPAHRPHIQKVSGEPISTSVFFDERYSGISAVLYCNSDLGNHPADGRIGDDFIVVHNPGARNPIPHRWLKCGVECWVEDDNLVINDWWKLHDDG